MRVVIELDFDDDDISDVEVYHYLNELMENKMLSYTICDASTDYYKT